MKGSLRSTRGTGTAADRPAPPRGDRSVAASDLIAHGRFVRPGPSLHVWFVLEEVRAGNCSVRSIARSLGVSAALVSGHLASFRADGLVSREGSLTERGRARCAGLESALRFELLAIADAVEADYRGAAIRISAVACTSSFMLEQIAGVRGRPLQIEYHSTAEEAVLAAPDAHFYVIGNTPAVQLMNIGLDLSILSELLPVTHSIVGRGGTGKLVVIGEGSVSASLVQAARRFRRDAVAAYAAVLHEPTVGGALRRLAKEPVDALLWEPFAGIASRKKGMRVLSTFAGAGQSSHVLVRNRGSFVEASVEERFVQMVRERTTHPPAPDAVVAAARRFLADARSTAGSQGRPARSSLSGRRGDRGRSAPRARRAT